MKITTHEEAGVTIGVIEGRFDAHTVGGFSTAVVDRIGPSRANVIVDLGGVEFMDSSALSALVTTLKRTMEHGGDVVLAAIPETARIILELTRLDQVFATAASIDAARLHLTAAAR